MRNSFAGLAGYSTGVGRVFSMRVRRFFNINHQAKGMLTGARGVGDVLKTLGYRNYFAFAAREDFSDTDLFLRAHGIEQIYGSTYFSADRTVADSSSMYAFDDRKLFDLAKNKLREIASQPPPFFFTIANGNMHAPGFLPTGSLAPNASHYANVVAAASRELGEFIDWAVAQDFFANTTIVILGDHLYPTDSAPVPGNIRDRRVFNLFINSVLPASVELQKNRKFSHFDMCPTLLDAIGIDWNARGFGLGRRIGIGEKSLLEIYSEAEFNRKCGENNRAYERLMIPRE